MKEIIFIRHAKSNWGTEFLKDVDRPLSERGYRDAYFMSEWYMLHKPLPDLLLTSGATRALNTALIFSRNLELSADKVKINHSIYEAPAERFLTILREIPDSISRLMLFGHNPGLTTICNQLTENIFFDNVPTCGIVSVNTNSGKWKELQLKKATLNYYQFPKDFKNKE